MVKLIIRKYVYESGYEVLYVYKIIFISKNNMDTWLILSLNNNGYEKRVFHKTHLLYFKAGPLW